MLTADRLAGGKDLKDLKDLKDKQGLLCP